tara:strand:+ start:61 stop:957 length:897 start_codon:yes stop_codon:yes gene_type:complete
MVTNPKQLKVAAGHLASADRVALMGTGGNLAIAQHMASDIYRHLDKYCFAPDSVNSTALGGDGGWQQPWIRYAAKGADLIILITCRIESPAVFALEDIDQDPDVATLLIAPEQHPTIDTLVIDVDYYHEFETFALMSVYHMIEECGAQLPLLPKSAPTKDVSSRCDVYCIDIDGTLTEPHDGDPWNAVPRIDRIKQINQLYDNGATIYLQTARGYISSVKRHPNDPQAQQRNADYMYRGKTEQQLKEWGVKYHSLYFGKPRASTYVDDRASHDSEFFALMDPITKPETKATPPFWHPV